jgi:hypothetical protein
MAGQDLRGGRMPEEQTKRRSDRIAMSIPIRVTGRDEWGQDFVSDSRTVTLSRHGATIILKQSLKPDQDLKIMLVKRSKGANFRVVGRIGGESDGFVYGVAQIDSDVDIWGIGFPPTSDTKRVVGRLLMECGQCKYQEIAYMNELEVQVFQANQELTRPCEKCRKATLWRGARSEAAGPAVPTADPGTALGGANGPQPSTVGRRRNTRVNTRLLACVRQLGFSDEVVMTENMSRGGLCFRSSKAYVSGSPIEVAVPFAAGGANIFVPARIAHVIHKESDKIYRIGVAYMQGEDLLRQS